MSKLSEDIVLDAVCALDIPGANGRKVTRDMISGIAFKEVEGGRSVFLSLEVEGKTSTSESLRKAIEKAVSKLDGVVSASVVSTAHKSLPQSALAKVYKIIAVASGKGGVGKSTTAVNLAIAMSINGMKVGLLDADIYGPSIPRLLGIYEKPELDDDGRMIPIERHGIKVMSIGFLVPEDKPVVWRGPMVHGALNKLLHEVAWGELDILIIDLPPGTGDAHLTIIQQASLTGAVIVSTPQDIALIDARKGIAMFDKTNVPVLGVIENMSGFICPHCGERSDIFGAGGAEDEANKIGALFLGSIPLDLAVRESSDSGNPIVISQPDSAQAKIYMDIAERLKLGRIVNRAY
ncbi:MAG: Mrp/NBP35 family ATP-binding protein [Alphaproteobacteria bacterium]|nr:Mrp/NBP35 family ATP-binding protein [Alphaproteobacteria bacterium]